MLEKTLVANPTVNSAQKQAVLDLILRMCIMQLPVCAACHMACFAEQSCSLCCLLIQCNTHCANTAMGLIGLHAVWNVQQPWHVFLWSCALFRQPYHARGHKKQLKYAVDTQFEPSGPPQGPATASYMACHWTL